MAFMGNLSVYPLPRASVHACEWGLMKLTMLMTKIGLAMDLHHCLSFPFTALAYYWGLNTYR